MPRVLITSCSPDALSLNSAIRNYLGDGFRTLLSPDDICICPLELAERTIDRFQPHLALAIGSLVPDAPGLSGLRRAVDKVGAILAVWLHDDPYELDYAFKAESIADVIFSNDQWSAVHYQHPNVHHLPLAGSPHHHFRPLKSFAERTLDVFFCGVAYPNRTDFLNKADDILSKRPVAILGSGWPATMRCAQNRRLTVTEMADHAQDARLTLNLGRNMDIANRRYQLPPSTPGPRTFEVALSGSAQLYDVRGLEIVSYFTPDREIFLIDGIDDLKLMLERCVDEPEAIYMVAEQAQRRALDEHTYRHRAERILQICIPSGSSAEGAS